MTTTDTPAPELTDEDYDAAIERLGKVYGSNADELIELLETVRDEEIVHTTDNEAQECVDDCVGCLTWRIADSVTYAVVGKAA